MHASRGSRRRRNALLDRDRARGSARPGRSRARGGTCGSGPEARPLRRLAGCRLGEQRDGAPRPQRPAGGVLQPVEHRLAQLRQLGHRLQRQLRVRGQLPRLQHLRPDGPGLPDPQDLRRLPGRPGRHVRVRRLALHVGRGDAREDRLQRDAAGDRDDPVPWRSHLRRQQHRGAGADRGGADVPRLAHAHDRHEPERRRTTSTSTSPGPPASGPARSSPAATATARSPIRRPRTSAST